MKIYPEKIKCKNCGEEKSHEHFRFKKGGIKKGYLSECNCKKCAAEYNKKERIIKIKEYPKKIKCKNAEKINLMNISFLNKEAKVKVIYIAMNVKVVIKNIIRNIQKKKKHMIINIQINQKIKKEEIKMQIKNAKKIPILN